MMKNKAIEPSNFLRRRKQTSSTSRGFTLIELLVVITIITLLISILLPALAAARKSAQAIACASHLRQIGQALDLYQQDHYHTYPIILGNATNNLGHNLYNSHWYMNLDFLSYLGFSKIPTSTAPQGTVITCPSADGKTASDNNPLFKNNVCSYAGNEFLGDRWYGGHHTIQQFPSPSKTFAFMDGLSFYLRMSKVNAGFVAFRHDNHANAVFLDDHVQSLKLSDIPTDQYNPFWNRVP